jgi:hypothetical protein
MNYPVDPNNPFITIHHFIPEWDKMVDTFLWKHIDRNLSVYYTRDTNWIPLTGATTVLDENDILIGIDVEIEDGFFPKWDDIFINISDRDAIPARMFNSYTRARHLIQRIIVECMEIDLQTFSYAFLTSWNDYRDVRQSEFVDQYIFGYFPTPKSVKRTKDTARHSLISCIFTAMVYPEVLSRLALIMHEDDGIDFLWVS